MKSRSLLFLVSLATPVLSQNFLEPLIVTASRSEQKSSETSYSTTSLDQKYLQENTRRSLPEALQYTPGVLVQKTAQGHGSPFIRGFTGRQNLLMVDGVRLNNSTWRSGPVQYWNTVDSQSIDHFELIRSQGSVLYGSDAAGGTMNVFTKSSDFRAEKDGQAYTGGSAQYEFRSNGQGSHTGRIEAEAGVGGKFGLLLGVTAKDFGDIESDATGRMRGTGYPEQDFDLRADWAVTPDSTLTLAHQSVNQDEISRWHRTLDNDSAWQGTAPGLWTADTYDQERSLTYLRYSGKNPQTGAPIQSWSATVSWQTAQDSEFQDRRPKEDRLQTSDIDLETLGMDVTLESRLGPGNLVYGMDYSRDSVDSSGGKTKGNGTGYTELLPVADDSNYELFGAFSQFVWEPVEATEVTSGVRYTHASAEMGRFYNGGVATYDASANWDSVVGSLRANHKIDAAWSLFGGISQAFRAPNLYDLTGDTDAKSGLTTLGSLDVDPEYFLTYEVGTRHQTEDTSSELTVFYTDVDDMITSVYGDSTKKDSVTTNASDAYIYGVEWQGAWRFQPQWTLGAFAAWQDGRQRAPEYIGGPDQDGFVTRMLPLSGSVSLRWTSQSAKYWVEGRLLAADAQDHLAAGDQSDTQRIPPGGTPGYVTASLYAGWDVNEHLTLHCGAENLTDANYRIHGSGQNEPGINGILGMKVMW